MSDDVETLFQRLHQACEGFPHLTVLKAGILLKVNCILNGSTTRTRAEQLANQIYNDEMNLLLKQYDSVTGRPRNVLVTATPSSLGKPN
jgi:hypothetical protein